MTEGFAEGWRPTPGDKVDGKVVDITVGQSTMNDSTYPIVELEDEGGTRIAVHAFHAVLKSELARRRPKIGDELEITYLGKKQDGGSFGKGYDLYKVRGGNVEVDWDQFGEVPQSAYQQAPPPATSPPPPPALGSTPPAPVAADEDLDWLNGD